MELLYLTLYLSSLYFGLAGKTVVTCVAHCKVSNFDAEVGSTARMKKILARCPEKKRLGNGASVSAFVRFLHPSKPFHDKYLAEYDKARIGDLSVFGREEKTIKRRQILCVLVTHQDFPGESFYVAVRNTKVESEGLPDDFFDQVAPPEAGEEQRNIEPAADNTEEVPNPYIGGVHFEDDTTAAMRARGIEVDDYNEPAPENVPRQEARSYEKEACLG
jgi:hypothetical protein